MGCGKVSALRIILLYCLSQVMLVDAADPAVTPGAKGTDVVKDVIKKIKDSGIFPDDKGLLTRIAQVESRCGDDANTYRDGYDGGIWQVDNIGFQDTQDLASHPGLQDKFDKIKAEFGIDWTTVTWEDLRKPLYSALAARLFLSNIPEAIPESLDDQATYWKKYYNTEAGDGTEQDFKDRASEVKGDPHVTQLVSGSDIPLCYNVFGEVGSIYNLLSDNHLGIKINAELDSRKTKLAKFLGELAVIIGSHTFNVNKDGATINTDLYDWTQDVNIEFDGIHFEIKKKSMQINLMGLVWVNVRQHQKSFLNIDIHHLGDFSENTGGILGDVANNVELVETKSGADLYLANDEETSNAIHLKKKNSCWRMPGHLSALGQGFEELVQKNKIGCMHC